VRRRAALAAAVVLAALVAGCGGDEEDGGIDLVKADPKFGKQPNFVFVLTDDQNYAQFTRNTMPNTFRIMGKHGTRFTDHIATTPVCCPSRASMLTGQYGHNNGVLTNVPGYTDLEDPENTLPTWLKRVGYRTGYVGKWLNGYGKAVEAEEVVPPGWDEWYGLVGGHGYYRFKASVNGEKTGARRSFLTNTLNKKAVAMVRKMSGDDPFFLQLSQLAPHGESKRFPTEGRCEGNAVPARRDEGRFKDAGVPKSPSLNEEDMSDKPKFLQRKRKIPPQRMKFFENRYACRLASLLAVDRGIGQLFRALAATNELKDTVFIFGSDNGVFHGEHRIPGGKGLPYHEAYKLAFAMRAPKRYRGGDPAPKTVGVPTANIDLVPTIVELAGAPNSAGDGERVMDGRSLVPLLGGHLGQWPDERPRVIEFDSGTDKVKPSRAISCDYQGVLDNRWLYVSHGRVPDSLGNCVEENVVEYYDLERDPSQVDNIEKVPGAGGPDATAEEERLAELLVELSDCSGIKGRDPRPSSGNYCR
jgi:arylsulfatase A-like enzyme